MARVIRHASRLGRCARRAWLRVCLGPVLAAVSLFAFVWFSRDALHAPAFVLLALSGGFFIWGEKGRSGWRRLRAGLTGERQVLRALACLPHGVVVETNLRVRTGHGVTEIDCLVFLGEELWVLEVKNVRGRFVRTQDGVRFVRPSRSGGEAAGMAAWERALDDRVRAVRQALGTVRTVRVRGALVLAGAAGADDAVRGALDRGAHKVWFTARGELDDWLRRVPAPDAPARRAIGRARKKLLEEAIT